MRFHLTYKILGCVPTDQCTPGEKGNACLGKAVTVACVFVLKKKNLKRIKKNL